MKYIYIVLLSFTTLSCKDNLQSVKITEDNHVISYTVDKEGKKQGIYVRLNDRGDSLEMANYRNDVLHGQRKIYKNGKVEILENYKDGAFHGHYTSYYPNGNIETRYQYTNNKIEGILYKYYPTGELKEKVSMSDNEENGPFEEYYKSGNIHWKGTYKNGDNEVGLLVEYSEEGPVIKKMLCGKYRDEYICQTIWDTINGEKKLTLQYDEE